MAQRARALPPITIILYFASNNNSNAITFGINASIVVQVKHKIFA